MTPNRLAQETSPYLLQHAHNPVDWYPWGEEALERARSEGKPILLSVGYAACHWCHVMERESFEDQETARLMNERFVCVKVDREERPDIDAIYMSAVQAMTGHGGWPMTVFLTPDGKPFYGGTYFPPEDRHGLPSFRRVLEAVGDGWRDRREEAARQASEVIEHIERSTQPLPSSEPLAASVLSGALRSLVGAVDPEWGGFGGAPKFPQAPALEFMLRMHAGGAPDAAAPLALTLDRMARGGMFDHVGGGFARYSVDRFWHVPHFEKMLYDNAQLLRLYTRAWLAMRRPLHREVALATAEYLLRDMRHPGGGFFSSQDADSEGVEGKFYVWSRDELAGVAGADGEIVAAAFDVRPEGNWEGTNVLWRPRDDDEVASTLGIDPAELDAALERARPRLFETRAARVPPATDDKILAGWNGLAISALAECGRALGRADLVDAAAAAAAFVLGELRTSQGRLLRSWREGRASIPAFLEDYAMVGAACLDLFETSFEPRWYAEARALAAEMLRLFSDTERGGFFDTGSDAASTVVRPRSQFDNATPSGASVAADLLLRLAALEGDPDLERTGAGAIRVVAAALEQAPQGFGCMLGALDRYLSGAIEVAVIGDPASAGTRALAGALHDRFLPNFVLAGGPPGATTPALLAGRTQLEGAATAYVCRNFACELPVTSPEDLLSQIGSQVKR